MRTQDGKICVSDNGALRNWDKEVIGWLLWVPDMMLQEWAPEGSALVLQSRFFMGTFSHPHPMWNLVSGSEGKKDPICSGPLSQVSLSCIPFPLLPFFLLPSPFFLAWCLKLTRSSFLPHATVYRPQVATAEVLLMDCIRTMWALHVWTTLSKGTWSWSQTEISRQLKVNFLLFVDGILCLPLPGFDWFPLSVHLL